MRVHTKRGWVVLASDASHYYEHFEKGRVFPTTFNIGERARRLRRSCSASPIRRSTSFPGHDPLVMQRYPAASGDLEGIAVRLDVAPLD